MYLYECELIGGPGDGHITEIPPITEQIVYQGHCYSVQAPWACRDKIATHTGCKAYVIVHTENDNHPPTKV